MKLGPVTSQIHNLIKASGNPTSHPSFWATYITKPNAYDVALTQDPGRSELSPAEECLIQEVFSSDGSKGGFALADECHKEFPEWKDPGDSSTPIEIADILNAVGASEDQIAHAESSIGAQRAARNLAV
jgi:hypothetical protein